MPALRLALSAMLVGAAVLVAGAASAAPASAPSPAPVPAGPPVATAPLPSLPFLPAGPVPLAEPAVALTPAAPAAAALLPAPLASPLASPTTAHRAPGTDGGEIVIEPIPASTHPANADPALTAARAAADARRAVLESPAAVQLGDRRASDDAVRLVGVKEEGGKTCREYQQTVMMDGTPVQAVSIVCRQRDGTWKLVE